MGLYKRGNILNNKFVEMGMIGKHNASRICDIRGENFKKVHFQHM